jgi:hypothetical protein
MDCPRSGTPASQMGGVLSRVCRPDSCLCGVHDSNKGWRLEMEYHGMAIQSGSLEVSGSILKVL